MRVRPARLQDSRELADLIRSLGFFENISAEEPHATWEHVSEHLAMCLADKSHSVLVAEAEAGRIVGYAAMHWVPYLVFSGPEGYLSELFVSESERGQGVGAALLNAAESEARSRGCDRLMTLNLRTRESYERGFYAKHGWSERPAVANFVRALDAGPE